MMPVSTTSFALVIAWLGFSCWYCTAETVAADSNPKAFWSADHETGDLCQWHDGDAKYPRGGIFNTGGTAAEAVATTDVAHSGRYSAKMTIRGAVRKKLAVRLMRWGNKAWDKGDSEDLPDEGYYSAWFYFPRHNEPKVWWNIFQFKSTRDGETGNQSQPMWTLNVDSDEGQMWLYLYTKFNSPRQHSRQIPSERVDLPIGRWVHIEALYKHSTTNDGRISIWQDGVLLYDVKAVRTAIGKRVTWGIGNYTDDIDPSTATIYADDAVISLEQIGVDGTR